jgi:uncharacterized protein (DUF433 family)
VIVALPEFLTRTVDGEILVTGHRIGLYHLIARYNEGESAEMLASRYPTLPLALVHHIIAYYLDNQADVDAYIADCSNAIAQQRSAAHSADVNSLRQRLLQNGNSMNSPKTQVH